MTPVVATFALLLGYLCGLRGKMLLDSVWTRMLDRTPAEIADLAIGGVEAGLAATTRRRGPWSRSPSPAC